MTCCNDEWDQLEREGDVVIPEQPRTAVYENRGGCVVILQAGQYSPDDDTIVLVQPHHARAIADALLRVANRSLRHLPPPAPSKAVRADRGGSEEDGRQLSVLDVLEDKA